MDPENHYDDRWGDATSLPPSESHGSEGAHGLVGSSLRSLHWLEVDGDGQEPMVKRQGQVQGTTRNGCAEALLLGEERSPAVCKSNTFQRCLRGRDPKGPAP